MTLVNAINPILLDLGPIEIRWYGLLYVLGILFVYFYVRNAVRQGKIGLTLDDFDSLMLWLIVAMIVGARLGWVLFYGLPQGLITAPLEIIAVWYGGLSFHGGLLGGILVMYLFARKKKISFLQLADLFVVPIAL